MRLTAWTLSACAVFAACGGESSTTTSSPDGTPAAGPSTPAGTLQKVILWRSDASGRYLHLVNENGTGTVTIAGTGQSAYHGTAPNGRIIFRSYFPAERQGDLYSINPDGTGTINLTTSPHDEAFDAVTSRSDVVFSRHHTYMQDGRLFDQYDILQVASDGSRTCAVADTSASERFVRLGPADRVIFKRCTDSACTLMIGDCSGVTTLSSEDGQVIGVTDSGRIVYTVNVGDTDAHLYSVGADGTNRIQLAAVNRNSQPLLHADSVVFNLNRDMFVVNTAGGKPLFLATDDVQTLPWVVTPSGRLVYHSGRSDGPPSLQSDVRSIRLDGTDARALAATAHRELADGLSHTGRVLYQAFPAGMVSPDHGHQLRSIKDDGSGDVILAGGDQARVTGSHWTEAVTATNRILYVDHDREAPQYDVYAIDETGTNRRYLYSSAQYGTSTVNDRIIYTAPCTRQSSMPEPVSWSRCQASAGDVYAIKSDGTGLIPLASGSEAEGFEAAYQR